MGQLDGLEAGWVGNEDRGLLKDIRETLPGGSGEMGGAIVNWRCKKIWEHVEFSFSGTCAQLQVAHWSNRTYGYFEVGHKWAHLNGPICTWPGGHCGSFYPTQVSITQASCLKVAFTKLTVGIARTVLHQGTLIWGGDILTPSRLPLEVSDPIPSHFNPILNSAVFRCWHQTGMSCFWSPLCIGHTFRLRGPIYWMY